MKKRTILFIVVLLFLVGLFSMFVKTPPIRLPSLAHHRTIGALPFAKAIDHGGYSYYNACVSALTGQCETIENKSVREKCKKIMAKECNTKTGVPKCRSLGKRSKQFGTFLCVTCEGAVPISWGWGE
jgi:hypothetical protein